MIDAALLQELPFFIVCIALMLLAALIYKPLILLQTWLSKNRIFANSGITHDDPDRCGFCRNRINDGSIQCTSCGATHVLNQFKGVVLFLAFFCFMIGIQDPSGLTLDSLKFLTGSTILLVAGIVLPTRIWVKQVGRL